MKKGDIAFKVVKKRSRKSCRVHNEPRLCRVYNKGTIVKKVPGTIGNMVFNKREYAQAFINRTSALRADMIIRVRVAGKILKVRYVYRQYDAIFHAVNIGFKFVYKALVQAQDSHEDRAPEGTYAVGQVEVLE